jgi:hypothetical protein
MKVSMNKVNTQEEMTPAIRARDMVIDEEILGVYLETIEIEGAKGTSKLHKFQTVEVDKKGEWSLIESDFSIWGVSVLNRELEAVERGFPVSITRTAAPSDKSYFNFSVKFQDSSVL